MQDRGDELPGGDRKTNNGEVTRQAVVAKRGQLSQISEHRVRYPDIGVPRFSQMIPLLSNDTTNRKF